MSKPSGLKVEDDRALRDICSVWRSAEPGGKGLITLAEEALKLLHKVGWAHRQTLPNNTAGCLGVRPKARAIYIIYCTVKMLLCTFCLYPHIAFKGA